MKKKKLKLSLNKETIASLDTNGLQEAKGGWSMSCVQCIIQKTLQITEGCDIPTIGHDDGPLCLSKEADWCHGN